MGSGASMSTKSQWSQTSSQVVSGRARYSASVLERKTTSYFLLRLEKKEVPNRKQKPVMEHRLVRSLAQSPHLNKHEAQEKTEKSGDHDKVCLWRIRNPKNGSIVDRMRGIHGLTNHTHSMWNIRTSNNEIDQTMVVKIAIRIIKSHDFTIPPHQKV